MRRLQGITADEILRAAGTAANLDCTPITGSALLDNVVMPALGQAEHAFSAALARINVEDLARSAEALAEPHPQLAATREAAMAAFANSWWRE